MRNTTTIKRGISWRPVIWRDRSPWLPNGLSHHPRYSTSESWPTLLDGESPSSFTAPPAEQAHESAREGPGKTQTMALLISVSENTQYLLKKRTTPARVSRYSVSLSARGAKLPWPQLRSRSLMGSLYSFHADSVCPFMTEMWRDLAVLRRRSLKI